MKRQVTKRKIPKRVVGFQVVEDECIWMKAGVVNFRICDNAYDCSSCPFDKGIRRAMGLGQDFKTAKHAPEWVDYLKKRYRGASRPCRHALTGRIEAPKICTLNYECYHCPFDQMLDDADLVRDTEEPRYRLASGYRLADGYYYHLGHSWARFEHGGRVRIGFDDFLIKLFGAIQSLTLPPLGEELEQNEVGWTFGRNKHRAGVLAPVTGTVLAVNHKAQEHPEITHEDPYHEGWLFILEPDMPKKNLRGLYFGEESFKWMEMEGQKLLELMGPEYEDLAATGGEPIADVYGNFPDIGWRVLIKKFLHTDTT
ncbi:MAG: glycine cleavage system protein H [Desulfobacterales bacterium]|jgi:glycine cleavage system H lipoate-binding protein